MTATGVIIGMGKAETCVLGRPSIFIYGHSGTESHVQFLKVLNGVQCMQLFQKDSFQLNKNHECFCMVGIVNGCQLEHIFQLD